MGHSYRSSTARRVAGLLVFLAAGSIYTALAIRTLLRSEQIKPAVQQSDWSLSEKLVAFPAFYFGVDPLTGLIINAVCWGLLLVLVMLIIWPRSKHVGPTEGAAD